MHEMSLALEIRSICERELAKLPETRVTAVGVEVGAFSGVEVDSLQFCLEVVRAPFGCPDCGMLARGVSGGGGLQLKYLEVE